MLHNLSSAALVIGTLRVNIKNFFLNIRVSKKLGSRSCLSVRAGPDLGPNWSKRLSDSGTELYKLKLLATYFQQHDSH